MRITDPVTVVDLSGTPVQAGDIVMPDDYMDGTPFTVGRVEAGDVFTDGGYRRYSAVYRKGYVHAGGFPTETVEGEVIVTEHDLDSTTVTATVHVIHLLDSVPDAVGAAITPGTNGCNREMVAHYNASTVSPDDMNVVKVHGVFTMPTEGERGRMRYAGTPHLLIRDSDPTSGEFYTMKAESVICLSGGVHTVCEQQSRLRDMNTWYPERHPWNLLSVGDVAWCINKGTEHQFSGVGQVTKVADPDTSGTPGGTMTIRLLRDPWVQNRSLDHTPLSRGDVTDLALYDTTVTILGGAA